LIVLVSAGAVSATAVSDAADKFCEVNRTVLSAAVSEGADKFREVSRGVVIGAAESEVAVRVVVVSGVKV
jgi:hypothetical protein